MPETLNVKEGTVRKIEARSRGLDVMRRFSERDAELDKILEAAEFDKRHSLWRREGWSDLTVEVYVNRSHNSMFVLECNYHLDLCRDEKIIGYGDHQIISQVVTEIRKVYERRYMDFKEE